MFERESTRSAVANIYQVISWTTWESPHSIAISEEASLMKIICVYSADWPSTTGAILRTYRAIPSTGTNSIEKLAYPKRSSMESGCAN